MRLLASTPRRIAATAALAAAGVLLPAAALAAPALTGSGSPAARTGSAVPACHGLRKEVWLGLGEGAAGMNQTHVPVEFSNTGRQACRLTGSPTITVVGRHGQIGDAAKTGSSQRAVVVPAGGTAHVILDIAFPSPLGPKCHPKVGQLHITLGGMSTDLTGYPVAQCTNPKLNLLTVDAIHSGVGVPAFTVR